MEFPSTRKFNAIGFNKGNSTFDIEFDLSYLIIDNKDDADEDKYALQEQADKILDLEKGQCFVGYIHRDMYSPTIIKRVE